MPVSMYRILLNGSAGHFCLRFFVVAVRVMVTKKIHRKKSHPMTLPSILFRFLSSVSFLFAKVAFSSIP